MMSMGSCCSKRDNAQKGSYIFHYGGSSPSVLAMRLACSISDIISRAIPCVVKGFAMTFAGKNKSFGMKSTATLMPMKGYEVRGYAILHDEREHSILNTFYGYPLSYDRINVLCRVAKEVVGGDILSKPGHACIKDMMEETIAGLRGEKGGGEEQ